MRHRLGAIPPCGDAKSPMRQPPDNIDWRLTTWEGSRREQLRRWAALPLERIILAIEEMQELSDQFRQMRETGKFSAPPSGQSAPPAAEAPAVHQPRAPYDPKDGRHEDSTGSGEPGPKGEPPAGSRNEPAPEQ